MCNDRCRSMNELSWKRFDMEFLSIMWKWNETHNYVSIFITFTPHFEHSISLAIYHNRSKEIGHATKGQLKHIFGQFGIYTHEAANRLMRSTTSQVIVVPMVTISTARPAKHNHNYQALQFAKHLFDDRCYNICTYIVSIQTDKHLVIRIRASIVCALLGLFVFLSVSVQCVCVYLCICFVLFC